MPIPDASPCANRYPLDLRELLEEWHVPDVRHAGGEYEWLPAQFTHPVDQPPSHFEACPRDLVVVQVRDSGTGIGDAVRDKIFDPFFTTKRAGTGLGLSICREISDFHGAQLSLTPRPDRFGTIAQAEFPVVDDPAEIARHRSGVETYLTTLPT